MGLKTNPQSLIFGIQLRCSKKLTPGAPCCPSASYRTNPAGQNKPRDTKWVVTKHPAACNLVTYQPVLWKEGAGYSWPKSKILLSPLLTNRTGILKFSLSQTVFFLKVAAPSSNCCPHWRHWWCLHRKTITLPLLLYLSKISREVTHVMCTQNKLAEWH